MSDIFDFPPFFVAGLVGFVSGLLLSVPVGPVNLTIMNEGARRGYRWAALIGLGAVVMEVIYCTIAFTSFGSFFDKGPVKFSMELFTFLFMLYLGCKFLMAKNLSASSRLAESLHPHSAFMTGFVRTMGNPGVLLFWIFLASKFGSREWWVQPNGAGKLSCITGVAIGTGVWFFGLSWAVSLGHKKFSEKTLLRMEHFSGIGLLVLALGHGLHIIWQMAKHKM